MMKRFLSNSYVKSYLVLVISLFAIELIFKAISGASILDWSILRIFLGINILSALLAFFISFVNDIARKILLVVIIFIAATYSCVQAGFYNFLGVYMSFQTSSQLGAVVDYVREFLLSFKWYYFLTFLVLLVALIYFIFLDRKKTEHIKPHIALITSLLIMTIGCLGYYGTVKSAYFQNSYQTISNDELFWTTSNPSIAVTEFGTVGYALLDARAMFFPVTIEKSYLQAENDNNDIVTDYSRIIDDSAWEKLIADETDEDLNALNNYFINRGISEKNEYTGLFEGKNLIVIMMESTNDIIINPEYYPNFYKLMSEGWYWENNYSPRNSCATMNNEFSGMTSLYSIYNTCTASKYKENTYYESIFNQFNRENYITFSAHDYTEAYYPRLDIHTNMGSQEYYGVEDLGITYSNEYRNWANDDEFMEVVLEIIDEKRSVNENFMTWLTTVSSHQPYGVSSIQGDMYLDMTEGTDYPMDVRRYMSKLKILDNALGVLLNGLEERGILDDTVIVLYGDHYPYGISTDHLNEVLDYDTSEDLNAERVPFVIYNSEIDHQVFSDYTTYINILPTLANLFNLDYDPRLYLGDDLLADDYQSLTVFADGSWKNELGFYDASKSEIRYYTSEEYTPEEIKAINEDIDTKMRISSDAIKENYFEYLGDALSEYEQQILNNSNNMCLNSEKDKYNIE